MLDRNNFLGWARKLRVALLVVFLTTLYAASPHEAAHSGNLQQLTQVLNEGVNVDSRDSFGGTSKHGAQFQDNTRIVKLLIEKGFDVNAVGTRNGYSPLFDAVWANNLFATKLLLEAGTRPDMHNLDALTTEQKALEGNKQELAELFKVSQINIYDFKARSELSPNDIKAFAYQWFANFDHQVPIERLVPHLGDNVDMAFPNFPIRSEADFARWYQSVIDNIQWNSHEISNLKVLGDQSSGWTVSMDIRWRARTYDGTQYDDVIHQNWQLVRSDDGTIVFKRHRARLVK